MKKLSHLDEDPRAILEKESIESGNFRALIPGGWLRDMILERVEPGQTFRDYLPKSEHIGRSDLCLNQTPEEFFALIDSLLEKHKIKLIDINPKKANHFKKKKIMLMVAPVFIDLRKMGYTNYELTV